MKRTIRYKGKDIPVGEVFYWNTTDQFFRGTLGNGVSRTVKTDDSLAVIECLDMKEQRLINGLRGGDICPTIVAGYYKQGAGKLLNYVGSQFAPGVLEIDDMKEQEIMNGTADGLCPTLRANYFKMGAVNFVGRDKSEDGLSAPCVIEKEDMKEQKLINELKDGTCPTVLASYHKKGGADLTREKYGHPFVMDIVNGDSDGNARTIVARYGQKGKSSIARNDGLGMTGVIEKEAKIVGYSRSNEGSGKIVGRHLKDIANTLTCSSGTGNRTDQFVAEPKQDDPVIAASRGRGEGWQQTLEFNTEGKSNTITTVPKDNFVVNGIPKGELRVENGCLIDKDGYRYRIRKLTPRECFRLQDVKDEDIDTIQAYRCEETGIILDALGNPVLNIEFQGPKKNEKKVMVQVNGKWRDYYQSELLYTKEGSGISRSAQYKLAGNSICVAPMYHTFRKLFIEPENENQQLELF